jgi:hypothetical protein
MRAFWRKQMRQSANLRYTLRGRPQTRQRRTVRVMNFGFLAALIRIARVAIDFCPCYFANGIPSSARSALARSSRPAVVTIVTFKPFDLSVFA